MFDRYSFFVFVADLMIVISLLVIAGVILLIVRVSAIDTSANMPGFGYMAAGMVYMWGLATIFANLLFITVGAIMNACVETARNTRAVRVSTGVDSTARLPT